MSAVVMNPSVLILTDEPELARAVISRWQRERVVPGFTVMGTDAWKPTADRQSSLMAVVSGEFQPSRKLLGGLEQALIPTIFLAADGRQALAARQQFQKTAVLKRADEWLDLLVLLAGEMLRRTTIAGIAADAEKRAREAERHAVLGKYMLEMRHTLNNALTSVLGNAELLLMEPGTLAGEAREQVDTIHNMALRMHEVIQRFSSIDAEMKFADNDGEGDKSTSWKSAASGR
jgi:signal transduction histidine kinase